MDAPEQGSGAMGLIPYAVLAGYLLALLGLGWLGYRRSKTAEEDYYLAGRRQGWIVSSLTIMATFFSSFALLGAPGMVYREGVVFALFGLNVPIAGLCVYLLGARIWRVGRLKGYVTPADMVSDYYGSQVALRLLVALTGFLYAIPYVMMQIQAGGKISAVLFAQYQYSFEVGAVLLAAITTVYIMIGGMRSVAWTDVLQGLLLVGGIFIGGVAIVSSFGGLAEFGEEVSRLPEKSLTIPGTTGYWQWTMLLTVCVFASSGSMVQPAQWMRFYAARDSATLRRAAVIFAIVLTGCFILAIMLVGLGGQVMYPIYDDDGNLRYDEEGNLLPHPDVGKTPQDFDQILVVVLGRVLPEMLKGFGVFLASLIIVAIMAASMSTADSNLHALSAVLVRDVYDRYIRPKAGERERVWMGRIVIVVATVVSLWLVFVGRAQQQTGSEYDFLRMIALLGLVAIAFSAQLLPLTLDMLFLRKGTRAGAALGLVAGLLAAFAFGGLYVPFVELVHGKLPAIEMMPDRPFAALAEAARAGQPLLVQVVFFAKGCQAALPIHATAWGLLFNVPVFVLVSLVTSKVPEERRAEFARVMSGHR